MKIVYILVTDGVAPYVDLTFLSASSVRRLMPTVPITFLSDTRSIKFLDKYQPLLDNIGEIKVLDLDTNRELSHSSLNLSSAMIRSRIMKTCSRFFIEGDYLFMDSDTLALQAFDELFRLPCELAFAPDRSARLPFSGVPSFAKELYRQINWTPQPNIYCNSGVFLARENTTVSDFFHRWFNHWKECVQKGCNYDQPALNYLLQPTVSPNIISKTSQKQNEQTTSGLGGTIHFQLLNSQYNAMPDAGPWFARNAKIMHFFTVNKGLPHPKYLLRYLLDNLIKTNTIDWNAIEVAAKYHSPWSPQLRHQWFWSFAYNTRMLLNAIR